MKQIWNITKYFLTFASFVTVCFGAFKLVDSIRDDVTDIKETLTEDVMPMVVASEKSDSLQLAIIKEMQGQVQNNTEKVGALSRSYTDYVRRDESLTKDEFIDYMDGLWGDIKKNNRPTVSSETSSFDGTGNIYTTENTKSNLNP
ncbi:MAG: hypothetical protein KAR19_03785 [Bacteroidales bacterium]|nr:hypothetical protein [Bacteroidales bacterium]